MEGWKWQIEVNTPIELGSFILYHAKKREKKYIQKFSNRQISLALDELREHLLKFYCQFTALTF